MTRPATNVINGKLLFADGIPNSLWRVPINKARYVNPTSVSADAINAHMLSLSIPPRVLHRQPLCLNPGLLLLPHEGRHHILVE